MVSQCPYKRAFLALQAAEFDGATVEWDVQRDALRIHGASEDIARGLARLAGVERVDTSTPEGLEAAGDWERVAAALPGCLRLARTPQGLAVVRLQDPMRLALARLLRAPQAAREMLLCSPTTLRELPLPWTLVLERVKGSPPTPPTGGTRARRPFVVSTLRADYERAQQERTPAFVARELEAMGLAAEVNRAHPGCLDEWLDAKARGPWRLTAGVAGALDVVGVREDQRTEWALGSVLDWYGVELLRADVHEQSGGA